MIQTDVPMMMRVFAPSEDVRREVLSATDPNNCWYEYEINFEKICTLHGKELYDQHEDIFKALDNFKHIDIEESQIVQGYDISESENDHSENDHNENESNSEDGVDNDELNNMMNFIDELPSFGGPGTKAVYDIRKRYLEENTDEDIFIE
jgi:hypothetical protein